MTKKELVKIVIDKNKKVFSSVNIIYKKGIESFDKKSLSKIETMYPDATSIEIIRLK